MDISLIIGLALLAFVVVAFVKTITIVPQRSAYVIERLGKYSRTLEAGFHILVPFIDSIAYKHNLKEVARDVAEQSCITKDNIQLVVDGTLYLQVISPKDASYGVEDYLFATTQLAQTTLRSIIGKIELDKTFEEREDINQKVVAAIDQAAAPWGIKVHRYEIANIDLPNTIKDALEKQMRAERERRAVVAESEGRREAMINVSEGQKKEMINISEGKKDAQINEATGKAEEIELLAKATASGIEKIAKAINEPGGKDAVSLRVAEQYVAEFGKLAKESTTILLPSQLSDIGGAVAGLTAMMGALSGNTNKST
jgi:regulator of protease activity HflC (stomatin/prohibitin superfamily)